MYSCKHAIAAVACVAALVVASGVVSAADLTLEKLRVPSGSLVAGQTMFTRLDAEQTGVDFQIDIDKNHPMRRLYEIAFAGAGITIGDYDNDGRPDIFMTHHGGGNRLYRQVDDFVFEDVSEEAGISAAATWSAGTTFVDINNDGYLDLYVNHYDAPNSLYINQQNGRFSEEAADWGIDYRGASVMAAFADYDRDGDLDMYLLTSRLAADTDAEQGLEVGSERGPGGRTRPKVGDAFREYSGYIEKPNGQFEQIATGQRDILFRNDNGHFSAVDFVHNDSQSGQIDDDYHMGMSVVWWDFNGDLWPDIYVANDLFGPDRLYRNNGDGSFTDVIRESLPHTPWFSMGSDFADINNDGLMDFIATDMSATTHYEQKIGMGDMDSQAWFLSSASPRQYMRNALYLNTGTDRFMEIAQLAGVSSTDWTWSAKLNDYDNDGRVDLFISNGMVRNFMDADAQREIAAATPLGDYWEILEDMPPKRDTNLAFRNINGLRFEPVGREWGLDHNGLSFGAAVADLDRDGDLDLIVNNLDEPVSIYRNDSQSGNRVLVRLIGKDSNSAGLGASVRIETSSGIQVRQLSLARGFMSADEAVIHFGLGNDSRIDRLTVSWPSGHSQSFNDIPAGNLLTIREVKAESGKTPVAAAPMYENVSESSGLAIRHRELPFDDYFVQPLLPAKLSQLGPGIAWGDVDNDGDDDVFVGGSAGQAGTLFINQSDGRFLAVSGPWLDHEAREDMAALWIDVDADGFLDLYVGSGSVEFEQGDVDLADRLYLNNGDGSFRHAPPGSLPQAAHASAAIAAADFDQDGDLDLFIGGRVVPGEYPLSPDSQLLRNDGGIFNDVTDEFAPALRKAGLVTGALWSDVDDDGDADLFVTVEWGPIRLFRNESGYLEDVTAESGLAELTGWWNGITSVDIDNDGDLDYVVTNVGLNTKYAASIDKPAILYYGDFGGARGANLIEAQWEDETVFPVRGLSCSSNAMPFIADEFKTFDSFARADIEQLFSPARLGAAERFRATELRSGMLINSGDGKFEFRPLPLLAQVAPAFGVVSGDFDLDGNADVYLLHNSYAPQAETGRMDGGVSLLLLGDGSGELTPVWPHRSGLSVAGDSKALTTTDMDGDGQADFVLSRNDDTVQVFRRDQLVPASGLQPLAIRLIASEPNRSGVGAKITIVRSDGSRQAAEIHAGAGYLSQSAPVVFFANISANPVTEILVRWPSGLQTSYEPDDGPVQVIRQ